MINEMEAKLPYTSLEFCFCSQNFEKIDINRRDLGIAGDIINYSMVSISAGSTEILENYMKSQGINNNTIKFYKIKLMGNFGIPSYLFKKAEGKDNERAIKEVVFETAATEIGGITFQKAITSQTAKTLATRTASRLGITLGSRILAGAATGAAFGSSIPIAGTIVGAIVGAWIAGKAEEWLFADEDEQLKKDKAHNAEIERLEKEYKLKIDRINDYLIRNHYIELRELTEAESEELCKESSNLKSSYFKTIMLMQSFPNYLDIDKAFYETLQEKALDSKKESKQLHIKPIADSIPLTIEIEK